MFEKMKERPATSRSRFDDGTSPFLGFGLVVLGIFVGAGTFLILEPAKVALGKRVATPDYLTTGRGLPMQIEGNKSYDRPAFLDAFFFGAFSGGVVSLLILAVKGGLHALRPARIALPEWLERTSRYAVGLFAGAVSGLLCAWLIGYDLIYYQLGGPIGPPRTRATIHWRLFDDGVDPYLLGLAGGLIGLALVISLTASLSRLTANTTATSTPRFTERGPAKPHQDLRCNAVRKRSCQAGSARNPLGWPGSRRCWERGRGAGQTSA